MKKMNVLIAVFAAFLMMAGVAQAAPTNENKGTKNPQVVSYYPVGNHTVIQSDGSIKYGQMGTDLVMEAGESKTFQQWYDGFDGSRVHTVWRNVGQDTSCPANWVFIQNPHQPPTGDTWGYHFPSGDNYCVKSN